MTLDTVHHGAPGRRTSAHVPGLTLRQPGQQPLPGPAGAIFGPGPRQPNEAAQPSSSTVPPTAVAETEQRNEAIDRVREALHGAGGANLSREDVDLLLAAYDCDHLKLVAEANQPWGYGRVLDALDPRLHHPARIRAYLTERGWRPAYRAGADVLWAKGRATVCVPAAGGLATAEMVARLVLAVAHAENVAPQRILVSVTRANASQTR